MLALSTVGAGLLNYTVQIVAARSLTLAAFGQLNSWIADTTVVLAVGGLAQIAANFFPLGRGYLAKMSLALLALSLAFSVLLIFFAADPGITPWMWTWAMLPISFCGSWMTGQLQLRLQFFAIGLASLVGSAGRLGLVYVPLYGQPLAIATFYLAVALSSCMAASVLALYGLRTTDLPASSTPQRDKMAAKMACALTLTFAAAILPQIDIICLRFTQTAEVLGSYARVSLFGKGVWFLLSIVLQITLPLRIRASGEAGDERTLRLAWLAEGAAVGVGVVAAIGSAFLGPLLAKHLLGFDLTGYRRWILFSGLMSTALFVLLRGIQQHCARLDWRRGSGELLGVCTVIGACYVLRPANVEDYFMAVLAYYVCLIAAVRLIVKPQRTFGR